MLSKVGKTFQSFFTGNNDTKLKATRKRLRDSSEDEDDLLITHTKRTKRDNDGSKDWSMFGTVAEYLVRASQKSFSDNSFLRGIARQASPHRILERISAFTPKIGNLPHQTNGNHEKAQSIPAHPPDSALAMDQSRTWGPPNMGHQPQTCPLPGALSGTVRPPANTGSSHAKTGYVDLPYPFVFPPDVLWSQDGQFKVPVKPPGRLGINPSNARQALPREPSRMPMTGNSSRSYNAGPRQVASVGRSASFQPTYDKLYQAPGLLNSRRPKNDTASQARTQLAAKLSWRLDEKNRYAQMLQQFTSVPLQGTTRLGGHLRREKKTATTSRDRTVLGTSIPQLSRSQPSAPQSDAPTLQEVAPRSRSPSPEAYLGTFVSLKGLQQRRQSSDSLRRPSIDSLRLRCDASSEGTREPDTIGKRLHNRKQPPQSFDDDSPVVILDSPGTSPRPLGSPVSSQSPVVEKFQKSLRETRYTEDWLKNLTSNRKEAIRACIKKRREEEVKLQYFQEQGANWEDQLEQRIRHKLKLSERIPAVEEYEYIESSESEEEEEEREEEFIELTEEQESVVDDALQRNPAGQVLSEGFRLTIRRSDMETLRGLNWLNDEIVNFYFELIRERGKLDNMPSVHVFNTFFYPKVKSQGQQGVRRWTKSVDIYSFDYIAIPIHLGMHWCLAVIDFGNKAIRYFDSMGGKNMECLNLLRKYLADEHQQKKGCPYDLSEWTLDNVTGIPHQMNGSDCGVFTCKFADYVTRNKELTFTQEQMPYFRRRMVYEIVSKELLS